MMLATNPSPGLSQFSINLLHNGDSLRNCSTPNGRSVSPKSADDNVSGSSATTASSPSTTPALLNNNSINQDNNEVKEKSEESKSGPENLFENISLLAQSNLWGNVIGGDQPSLMDAALYAMASQPLGSQMRDPEVLQQLLKQHAFLQRQIQPNSALSALQLRQRAAAQQLIGAVASSSSNSSSSVKSEPVTQKPETGQSPDKKRVNLKRINILN